MRCTAYNSRHTATLRSAQISLRETSYVCQPMNRNVPLKAESEASFRFIEGGCAMLQPEDRREEVLQSDGLSEASLRPQLDSKFIKKEVRWET